MTGAGGCDIGTVTMWSPNSKEPQIKMLCHGGATRSVAVDGSGRSDTIAGTNSLALCVCMRVGVCIA